MKHLQTNDTSVITDSCIEDTMEICTIGTHLLVNCHIWYSVVHSVMLWKTLSMYQQHQSCS